MDEKNKDAVATEKKPSTAKKATGSTSKSGTGANRGRPAGSTKKSAVAEKPVVQSAPIVQAAPAVQVAPTIAEPVATATSTLELHTRIPVRNAFPGGLTYRDSRTGLMYKWSNDGDVEYMELGELRTARNTQPIFFENNWWEIDEVHVLEWLNATKFYKGSLMLKDFDVLLDKSPDEIVCTIAKIPEAQKDNLILRVRAKVAAGEIDSLKAIRALEGALGVRLTEEV